MVKDLLEGPGGQKSDVQMPVMTKPHSCSTYPFPVKASPVSVVCGALERVDLKAWDAHGGGFLWR